MRLPDKMITTFRELVRCGIWGTDPDVMLFNELNSTEWEYIFQMICKHAVAGITCPVIEKLPATAKPPRKVYLEWCGMALHIKNSNRHMYEVYKKLITWFEQAGVYPVLMKGMGVAAWYPHPMLRVTGDIDIYINKYMYETAVAMLKEANIPLKRTPEHDEFVFNGVEIELHTDTSHYGEIFEKENSTTLMSIEGTNIRIPSVEANALLLIKHPAKHMFTSGSAIRHLCDWAVFLHKNHERIDYELIKEAFRNDKTDHFAMTFTSLAVNYLKLDKAVLPSDWLDKNRKKQERILLNDLLAKGDCGIHYCHDRHAMSDLSFSWSACKSWIAYYGNTFIRLCQISVLFPEITRNMLLGRIKHRIKMLVMGRPFASC